MILNMHIRNDYSNWGIEYKPKKRVTTLCGKMSVPKYCGIPGLTLQEPVVINAQAGDFGWCVACCEGYWKEVNELMPQIKATGSDDLDNMYHLGLNVVKLQVILARRAVRAMSPK